MAGTVKSQTDTLLLLGAGYSARAMIAPLRARGMEVIATTRSQNKAKALSAMDVKPVLFKGTVDPLFQDMLSSVTHIIASIPPDSQGDPILRQLQTFDLPKLRWAAYLSATSVYGNRDGHWVFEDEHLYPVTPRGKARVEAELQWLETGWPVHIFRLAGIYGGRVGGMTRNPFERLAQGTARAVIKPGHVVNRIHVDDIANALLAAMDNPHPQTVFNLADDNPCPPQDVLNFAAQLIGAARPPQLPHGTAKISDMARSFYAETKRVSNMRAKAVLGWQQQFPHFRKGLMAAYRERLDGDPVILAGHMDVPAPRRKFVRLALDTHSRLTHAERGCRRFDVTEDPDIAGRFHVIEIFDNAKAFALHQARTKNSEWSVITRDCPRDYDSVGSILSA